MTSLRSSARAISFVAGGCRMLLTIDRLEPDRSHCSLKDMFFELLSCEGGCCGEMGGKAVWPISEDSRIAYK